MIRSIVGFRQDEEGQWVAELSCLHTRPVPHRSPTPLSPRVLGEARTERPGIPTECARCDRAELPEGLELVGRAGPWDEGSVPTMLRQAHRTPTGRWGRLLVRSGRAGLQLDPLGDPTGAISLLAAGDSLNIPPDVPHRVVLSGPVQLEIELWGQTPSDHRPLSSRADRPGV